VSVPHGVDEPCIVNTYHADDAAAAAGDACMRRWTRQSAAIDPSTAALSIRTRLCSIVISAPAAGLDLHLLLLLAIRQFLPGPAACMHARISVAAAAARPDAGSSTARCRERTNGLSPTFHCPCSSVCLLDAASGQCLFCPQSC